MAYCTSPRYSQEVTSTKSHKWGQAGHSITNTEWGYVWKGSCVETTGRKKGQKGQKGALGEGCYSSLALMKSLMDCDFNNFR